MVDFFLTLKTLRPITLVALGSIITFLLVLTTLLAIHLTGNPLDSWMFAVFPISIGAITFLSFYILISRYLNSRIRLIYRNILTQKMGSQEIKKINLTENVVGNLEAITDNWAKGKQDELSRLKEQDEFRREFLGNISHELKTPIFSIQGYILTLLEGGLEDEEVNHKFLLRASKGVDRITHILDDLDTITRLESNKIEMVKKKFNIIDLSNEIIDDLQIKATEKGIRLKTQYSSQDLFVLADRGKISQVFTNLISNSIHYGQENGETEIRIYYLLDGLTVEISDNGPGIEQEQLPRLFERFYRVDKSRVRNEGGTGLGLAIVKHIIDSHGQSISVRSTIDVGSTFSFTLEKA